MEGTEFGGYLVFIVIGSVLSFILAVAWTMVPFILMGIRKDLAKVSSQIEQLHYLLRKHDNRETNRKSEQHVSDQ